MSSYWDHTSKHAIVANELFERLVPPYGNASTAFGEAIRAAHQLVYEHNNNGWGNNVTGAVKYLEMYFNRHGQRDMADMLQDLEEVAIDGLVDYVPSDDWNDSEDESDDEYDTTQFQPSDDQEREFNKIIEKAMDTLIHMIHENPTLESEPAFEDMDTLSFDR